MIINEQLLKRKRVYFHGSKYNKLNTDNAHYDCFFITCDITTAILYCKKTEEELKYIHTFTIDKPLKIFNAKSEVDYARLYKALIKAGSLDFARNRLWELRDNDWSQLDDTLVSRGDLINIIKDLGYDGFFNFEWYEDKVHPNEQARKPSIGIFDIGCLSYTGVQPVEAFKTTKFTQINKSDISKVKAAFISLKRRCKSIDDYNRRVEKFIDDYGMYYSTLTKKDFLDIANSVEYKIDESMADYYEQRYQEICGEKAKEIGLKVPPIDLKENVT